MDKLFKNISPWLIMIILLGGILVLYQTPEKKPADVSLSQVVSQINEGQVKSIDIEGNALTITLQDGATEKASKESETSLTETFSNYGVNPEKLNAVSVTIKEASGFSFWAAALLPFLLPFILISLFIWFMMRQAQRGNAQALSFGLSRARVLDPKDKRDRKSVV